MHPEQRWLVTMRAQTSMNADQDVPVDSAFAIVQTDAWDGPRISVAKHGVGSTARARRTEGQAVHLRGLSRPTECPSDGKGDLTIGWAR
jgi:hypothetical protein